MALRLRSQSESGRKVIGNPGETGWGLARGDVSRATGLFNGNAT